MNDLVCLARSGVVVSLALDRPETLNAFDAARVDQLSAALEDGASAGVRLVVPDPPGEGPFRRLRLYRSRRPWRWRSGAAVPAHRADAAGGALCRSPPEHWCTAPAMALRPILSPRAPIGSPPPANYSRVELGFGVMLDPRRLTEVVGRDHARSLLSTSPAIAGDEALPARFSEPCERNGTCQDGSRTRRDALTIWQCERPKSSR